MQDLNFYTTNPKLFAASNKNILKDKFHIQIT